MGSRNVSEDLMRNSYPEVRVSYLFRVDWNLVIY
jgi:hypothetical protein